MSNIEKDISQNEYSAEETFSLDDILKEFSDESLMVSDEDDADVTEDNMSNKVVFDENNSAQIFTDDAESSGREQYAEEGKNDDDVVAEEEQQEELHSNTYNNTNSVTDNNSEQSNSISDDYDIIRQYKPVGAEDIDELLKDVSIDLIDDDSASPGKYSAIDSADISEVERQITHDEIEKESAEQEKESKSFGQKAVSPFLALMALISLKRQQRQTIVKAAPPEDAEDLGPEMNAEKASRYYGSQMKGIRFRVRISAVLTLVLMYISFGLPVFGRLKNISVCSIMCLIIELAVIIVCLDIFTAGIMDLTRKKPTASSLISISCVISAFDAIITAATASSNGLPFCAVSALSITCAEWSSLLQCKGNRISLRTLALSKTPKAVTAESGLSGDDVTLLKSETAVDGFVRRTEEITPDEIAYSTMAPWLMISALVLSLLAAVISKDFKSFVHILSAIFLPAAPISALLSFPLPYSVVSRRIFHSGSAIAGWSGTYDIGGSKHIIITDSDIFPKETIAIESIRVLEGMSPEKIISYAGSVICASGSGLSYAFTELMKKNGCALVHVDEFCCHEGGGLTAMINGEEVLCGNSGFMRLMGIRLPQKLASKTSIFVSVNGMISAIFTMSYTPVVTVQNALISLLRSRRQPIFAIRDFNVTPEMIRHKFRIPTDGFDFPSFAKRYEISSTQRSSDSKIAGIISRSGLSPLAELSEEGHRLYLVVRLSTMLSILCTVIGMILMFFLCCSSAFDSVTVKNMLLYMIFWMIPEFALVFGLSRK